MVHCVTHSVVRLEYQHRKRRRQDDRLGSTGCLVCLQPYVVMNRLIDPCADGRPVLYSLAGRGAADAESQLITVLCELDTTSTRTEWFLEQRICAGTGMKFWIPRSLICHAYSMRFIGRHLPCYRRPQTPMIMTVSCTCIAGRIIVSTRFARHLHIWCDSCRIKKPHLVFAPLHPVTSGQSW